MRRKIFDEDIIFLRKLGMSGIQIAKILGVSYPCVSVRYRRLIREGYIERVYKLNDTLWLRYHQWEEEIIALLKKRGWLETAKLAKMKHYCTCQKLIREKALQRVRFSFMHGSGRYKRNMERVVFKKNFQSKTFVIVNDRKYIVRLMMTAIRIPRRRDAKQMVAVFLKRYLSKAESIAVFWKFGQRKWSHSMVPSSIQVDGVVKAKRSSYTKPTQSQKLGVELNLYQMEKL